MDRLTIINDALLNTGNNQLNVEYDGSVEWQAADSAYRRSIAFLIPRHPWNWANKTAPLAGLLASSPHPLLDKAYALPGDCLMVEAAWVDGYPLGEYDILDQKFCCRYASGLQIKYVRTPDVGQWPDLFIELLTMKVESYLLRGLNEGNRQRPQARCRCGRGCSRRSAARSTGRRRRRRCSGRAPLRAGSGAAPARSEVPDGRATDRAA